MMMKCVTLKEVPTIVSILLFVASTCLGTTSSSDAVVIVNANAAAEIMTNLRAKRNNINHNHIDDSYTSSVYFNSRLGLIRRRLEEEQEEEEEEEAEEEEEEEQENDAEDDEDEDEDEEDDANDEEGEEEANDEEEDEEENDEEVEEEEKEENDDAAVDEEEEQEEGEEVAEDADDAVDADEEEFDWTSYHSYENKYESMTQSNRIWSIVVVCWWALLIVLTCIFCCEDGSKSSSKNKQSASNKQPRYICSKCSKCDSDSSSSSTQDSLKEALAVEEDFDHVDHENDEIVREEISEHQGIQKVCRYYYKKATDEIEF